MWNELLWGLFIVAAAGIVGALTLYSINKLRLLATTKLGLTSIEFDTLMRYASTAVTAVEQKYGKLPPDSSVSNLDKFRFAKEILGDFLQFTELGKNGTKSLTDVGLGAIIESALFRLKQQNQPAVAVVNATSPNSIGTPATATMLPVVKAALSPAPAPAPAPPNSNNSSSGGGTISYEREHLDY